MENVDGFERCEELFGGFGGDFGNFHYVTKNILHKSTDVDQKFQDKKLDAYWQIFF